MSLGREGAKGASASVSVQERVGIDGIPRDGCPYIGDESVIDRTLDASTPDFAVQRAMLVWFANNQHGDGSIPASPIYQASLDLLDYNAYWVQTLDTYVLYSGDVGLAQQLWPQLTKLLDVFYVAHTQNNLFVNTIGNDDYAYIRRHGSVVAYYNAQYVLALRDAVQIAQWVGDPDTEEDYLRERSPITCVDQVQAALLVIQGAKDPRVVKSESDQMVERLRELGREVEYFVFEDEGHGFTRYSNDVHAYRLTCEWLESHLA